MSSTLRFIACNAALHRATNPKIMQRIENHATNPKIVQRIGGRRSKWQVSEGRAEADDFWMTSDGIEMMQIHPSSHCVAKRGASAVRDNSRSFFTMAKPLLRPTEDAPCIGLQNTTPEATIFRTRPATSSLRTRHMAFHALERHVNSRRGTSSTNMVTWTERSSGRLYGAWASAGRHGISQSSSRRPGIIPEAAVLWVTRVRSWTRRRSDH